MSGRDMTAAPVSERAAGGGLRAFLQTSYLGRLLLIPYRIAVALRNHRTGIGAILRWSVTSREHTNFTYGMTDTSLRYLADTVAIVAGIPVAEAEAYLREPAADAALIAHVVDTTRASPYRYIADARCEFGRRIGWYAIVRAMKPETVVETGIDKGLGAVLLCRALLRNTEEGRPGRYYGTDINPKAGYLLTGPFAGPGRILYGDSIASLKALDRRIDVFVNDSDHSADYEYAEYQAVAAKLSERAIVIGDNAKHTDRLERFARETGRRFLYFAETVADHWYAGEGIGFAWRERG